MGAITPCAPHEKLREGTDNLFLKWIGSQKGRSWNQGTTQSESDQHRGTELEQSELSG